MAYVCVRLIAGIMGSNLAEGMDVRLLCLLCRKRPLRRADHSFRETLPFVCVCLNVCDLETSTPDGQSPVWAVVPVGLIWFILNILR